MVKEILSKFEEHIFGKVWIKTTGVKFRKRAIRKAVLITMDEMLRKQNQFIKDIEDLILKSVYQSPEELVGEIKKIYSEIT